MKKTIALIIAGATLVCSLIFSTSLFENLEADQVMVVQAPFSGTLTWHLNPGTKWQGFGTVTKYPRRVQLWFSSRKEQGKPLDESLKIRFNDGAHATISGSLSYELPMTEEKLNDLHMKFHSAESVEHQMLRPNLEKSVYMTGPLMSSAESYASRRNDLLGIIGDQFTKGVYRTSSRDERTTDPLTNQSKTVKIVEPVKDLKTGEIAREEESPLIAFGITAFNISINDVKYDETVEAQIQKQQESIMAVQTSLATTKMAEQKKLTTVAEGEASAAEAEWKQKVIAAQATAEADQLKLVAITKATQEKEVALTAATQALEVAQLETQAAEQKKLADILLGEGEATRKQLVMTADGALQQKLEAWVQVNQQYATAIGMYQGAWVPSVVMAGGPNGTSTSNTGSGAQDLISLLTVKTAKDLAIDTTIPAKAGTLPAIKRPEVSTFKFEPTGKPTTIQPTTRPPQAPTPAAVQPTATTKR